MQKRSCSSNRACQPLARTWTDRGAGMKSGDLVSLSGAVAVVTGGGRGIGQAIAAELAELDATLVLTGRDETRVQQVAQELSSQDHRVEGIGCDITDLTAVEALGERLRKAYGRVDI